MLSKQNEMVQRMIEGKANEFDSAMEDMKDLSQVSFYKNKKLGRDNIRRDS